MISGRSLGHDRHHFLHCELRDNPFWEMYFHVLPRSTAGAVVLRLRTTMN